MLPILHTLLQSSLRRNGIIKDGLLNAVSKSELRVTSYELRVQQKDLHWGGLFWLPSVRADGS